MALFPRTGNVPAPYGNVQVRSMASIVAILCAVASFYYSSHARQGVGVVLAVVAIVAGLLGGIKALSPRVSGGILSIAAVALGAIAILFAIVALVL